MQLDPLAGFVRCPSAFCQGGTHVERLCSHSTARCPCDVFEKECTLCGGTGFVLEEGAAASGSQPPRAGRRVTADVIGRGW